MEKIKNIKKIIVFMMTALISLFLPACSLFTTSQGGSESFFAISQTEYTLEVGQSIALTCVSSTDDDVYWLSYDENVATVENGVITGISEGKAQIVAVCGDESAMCNVTVNAKKTPDTLILTLSSLQLKKGESITLIANSSLGEDVVWSSSKEEVAAVDDGVVTGNAAGVATITATTASVSASCVVVVLDDSGSGGEEVTVTVAISKFTVTINRGATYKLSAVASDGSPITWSSSDESIATVDGTGLVTGVMQGTALITASTDKASARCAVIVEAYDETEKEDYVLVWSDEFNGTSLDTTKWNYQTGVQDVYGNSRGPMYWGNNELQYYTEDSAKVEDGSLVITAQRRNMGDRPYTSARIVTRDKASFTYGYVEAKIKMPAIDGMWPAFWMLPQPSNSSGTDNEYGGWAANGEIDIMEAKGRLLNKVDTTLHFGRSGQSTYKTKVTTLTSNIDEWHTYAVEWTSEYIAWIVDGEQAMRLTNDEWWTEADYSNPAAPFDKPFYILFNLAVGGQYDNYVEPDSSFTSASMYVDYVRVYQAK